MSERDQIQHLLTTLNSYRTLLGDAAVDAVLAPMSDYIGEQNLPQAERRIITVLFADLVGFTSLATELDPEETRDLINSCFDALVPSIERYGGTIDKFIGDAVMVVFGAPVSHENDAERAVRTALEMLQAIEHFNDQYATDLAIHIGINSGLVVAGGIGSQGRQSYTVIGDTVNVASRLVNYAEAQTILIGADTYRAVAALVTAEALEPIQLKGKPQPVEAYLVVGLAERPGLTRGIHGLQAPLIGRDQELAGLRAHLGSLEDGRGCATLLIGEAGIGKSRLIRTLQVHAQAQQIAWYSCHGVAYDTQRPYSMFGQLFRHWFDLSDNATSGFIRQRLQERLHNRMDLAPVSLAVLEMLISNHMTTSDRLSGESFQRQLKRLMIHWWRYEAQQQPLVLVFDDLHWADRASTQLLQDLIQETSDVPLLIVCATRPDWDDLAAFEDQLSKHLASSWQLKPLSNSDSDELVNHLLKIADIPSRLRSDILHKSEGIPFFVEEIVRELIDRGVVVQDDNGMHWHTTHPNADIDLPENLQTLLIARIDRLRPTTKSILQQAAVIGRTFNKAILQELQSESATLEALQELQAADLVLHRGVGEYLFRHALTQEAAYQTILVQERRQLHAQVGAALERSYPERQEELAPQLAFHFRQAGANTQAFRYGLIGADAASTIYAHDQAIALYNTLIELDSSHDIASSEQRIHIYSRIGRNYELNYQAQEAQRLYEAAINYAEQLEDLPFKASMMLSLATLFAIPSSVQHVIKAEQLARDGLEQARILQDPAIEARALWCLSLALDFGNRTEEGLHYGLQSLYIARQHQFVEQQAYTQNDLSRLALALEGPESAIFHYEEARPLWRELNNLPMLVDNLNGSALMYFLYGDLDKAQQVAVEAYEISQRIGNEWGELNSLNWQGCVFATRGQIQAAIHHLDQARLLSDQHDITVIQTISTGDLAWNYSSIGQLERAEDLFNSSYMQRSPKGSAYLSQPLFIKMRFLIRQGNYHAAYEQRELCIEYFDPHKLNSFSVILLPLADAELAHHEQNYQRMIDVMAKVLVRLKRYRTPIFIPDVYLTKAWGELALEDLAAAQQSLVDGIELAEKMGNNWVLSSLYMLRGYLADQQHDPTAAEYWQQAQTLINAQAVELPSAFQATFYQTPRVKAALERSFDPRSPMWF